MKTFLLHKALYFYTNFIPMLRGKICYKSAFLLFSKKFYNEMKSGHKEVFKHNLAFPNAYLVKNYKKHNLTIHKKTKLFDAIKNNKDKRGIIIYCANDKPSRIFYYQYCHVMFTKDGFIYDNEYFLRRKITRRKNNLFCRFVFFES